MKEIKINCSECGHGMTVKFKEDWKQKYINLKKEYDTMKIKLTSLEMMKKTKPTNPLEDIIKGFTGGI
jgi:hypothetical protein